MCLWLNMLELPSWSARIFHNEKWNTHESFSLSYNFQGSMGFNIYDLSGKTVYKNIWPNDLGNWFHYCAVYDAEASDPYKISVYKNGVKESGYSQAHTVSARQPADHVMMLGHPNENGGGSYLLDEMYVWEEKLSDAQIADLYNAY